MAPCHHNRPKAESPSLGPRQKQSNSQGRPTKPRSPRRPPSLPGGSSGLSADPTLGAPAGARTPAQPSGLAVPLRLDHVDQAQRSTVISAFWVALVRLPARRHCPTVRRDEPSLRRDPRGRTSASASRRIRARRPWSAAETRTGRNHPSQRSRSRTGTRLSLGTPWTLTLSPRACVAPRAADMPHGVEGRSRLTRDGAGPASRTLFAETRSSRARSALT
jgi:hypothetical protein